MGWAIFLSLLWLGNISIVIRGKNDRLARFNVVFMPPVIVFHIAQAMDMQIAANLFLAFAIECLVVGLLWWVISTWTKQETST